MAKRGSAKSSGAKRSAAGKRRAATAKGAPAARKRGLKKATAARPTPRKAGATKAGGRTVAARRRNAARAAASRSSRRTSTKPPSALTSARTAVRGALAGAVAAVANTLPWAAGPPDAVTLLETDHRRLEALLEKGSQTTSRAVKGRKDLLDSLTSALTVHELIEEKLLYPALEAHREATDIVLEGYQEHHVADVIVKELHGLARNDAQWGAKFKVLKENIEHHIKEEEGEMFRTARAVLGRDELLELGAKMAALKARSESR